MQLKTFGRSPSMVRRMPARRTSWKTFCMLRSVLAASRCKMRNSKLLTTGSKLTKLTVWTNGKREMTRNDLNQIETIVIVMLENRSFDHQLGYLTLPPYNRTDVEGLKPEMMNSLGGADFHVFRLPSPDKKLLDDPPHDRYDISIQLTGLPGPAGPPPHPMIGFVESYSQARAIDTSDQPMVMGYFTGQDLPATNFFVQNFGICDHWFASLPSGTQSNRLMAMAGYTRIEVNQQFLLPSHNLVYQWLEDKKVRWRVYHRGIPFAILIDGWHTRVLTDDHFRDYGDFQDDVLSEPDNSFPKVIFIDPRFADPPHFEAPTDDHPPSPAIAAQQFLLRI